MNREIKFRGKHLNKWVYGYLLKNIDDNKSYISVSLDQFYQVKEETIGQYVGLKDKNGVEVYEGDIVRIVYDSIEHIYQIIFDKEELNFKATNGEINYGGNFQYLGCCEEIEVIGNIYENEVD